LAKRVLQKAKPPVATEGIVKDVLVGKKRSCNDGNGGRRGAVKVESEADLEGLRRQPGEGMEEEKGGFFQRAQSLSLSNAAPVANTQALACSSCGGRDDGNTNPVRQLEPNSRSLICGSSRPVRGTR